MELSMKKRVAYKKESAFCAIGLAFLVLNVIAPLAHGWELVLPQWQDSSERKAGTRQTIKIGEENYGFVWIPAGEFDMGSPESEVLRLSGEKQIHVKLTRGFWALETEVTQALYQEVTGRNPSYNNNPALPVECVTYNDVVSFCEELTKRLPAGLTADLPTEAEWEYACRAGSKTTYNWGDKSDPNRANVGESKKGGLTPPASYPANAWGLYDMHGNVSEWVKDWRAESYVDEYGSETVVDPKGPKEGVDRVTRGGSWGVYALVCRSAYRYWRVPEDSENDLGARIVLRPQSAESPTGISHVIFIGVDGGGTFFRDADTPNLDKIFADGAVTYSCLCENPTISAENWGAMLHGVKREIHGLTNGLAYSTPYPDDSPYPSVFRVIRENMPGAKLASICSWNPINIGVIENGIGVFKDKVPDDAAGVTEKVCEYLEKNQPTLLYVHYNVSAAKSTLRNSMRPTGISKRYMKPLRKTACLTRRSLSLRRITAVTARCMEDGPTRKNTSCSPRRDQVSKRAKSARWRIATWRLSSSMRLDSATNSPKRGLRAFPPDSLKASKRKNVLSSASSNFCGRLEHAPAPI